MNNMNRSWKSVSEVDPKSFTGHQVQLVRDFIDDNITASSFARQWFRNRSLAISARERTHGRLETGFNEIFFALEERFSIDPSLRDEGDLTDAELKQVVSHWFQHCESQILIPPSASWFPNGRAGIDNFVGPTTMRLTVHVLANEQGQYTDTL